MSCRHTRYNSEEIAPVDCSHKYKINQGVMVSERRPSVEEDLRWKTTYKTIFKLKCKRKKIEVVFTDYRGSPKLITGMN